MQRQFLPKRSRNASARRRETLLPPASRSRRPDERIAPLFACLHSHFCSADGTGKKKGLRIHPPHLEARVCAAEGVRLRQRFDFFFFPVRQSRPLGYLLLGKPQPLIQTFQTARWGSCICRRRTFRRRCKRYIPLIASGLTQSLMRRGGRCSRRERKTGRGGTASNGRRE